MKLINNERNSLTVKSTKAQLLNCVYDDNAHCTINAIDYCAKNDYAGCFGFATDYCENDWQDTVACGPYTNDTY